MTRTTCVYVLPVCAVLPTSYVLPMHGLYYVCVLAAGQLVDLPAPNIPFCAST